MAKKTVFGRALTITLEPLIGISGLTDVEILEQTFDYLTSHGILPSKNNTTTPKNTLSCSDEVTQDSDIRTKEASSIAICGNGILEFGEECDDRNTVSGDGCSAQCESEKVVLLVMDDMQSGWLEDIQEYAVQMHIDNNIPTTLGVVPGITTEPLVSSLKRWDANPLIEIAQHDFMHNTTLIDQSYAFQYDYLKQGTDLMREWGIKLNSFVPAAGQADDTTIDIAEDLGFHTVYEGIYLNITPRDEPLLTITNQLNLCIDNAYGYDCLFTDYLIIQSRIEQKIEEYGVALITYHMQDFADENNELDVLKINQFLEFANNLKEDMYTLMTVEQYYQFKTKTTPPTICHYAKDAEASSELPGYEGAFAVGKPDADQNCGTIPTTETAWEKENWDVVANISLTFPEALYPKKLTVIGDYAMCIARIWVDKEGDWYLAWEGLVDKDIDID
ncbi:MAG: DUF2334 domain-containing protein, partial [Thermodesulfobacteriota bacterium]|nr:DUF2334 domain-containing protein [Thermodesulfobacteriota bacterium]